jgi:hypothetical protein
MASQARTFAGLRDKICWSRSEKKRKCPTTRRIHLEHILRPIRILLQGHLKTLTGFQLLALGKRVMAGLPFPPFYGPSVLESFSLLAVLIFEVHR